MAGAIPAPLGALSALRALKLRLAAASPSGEPLYYQAHFKPTYPPPPPGAFAPLSNLSALTSLALGGSCFPALPAELSALGGLKVSALLAPIALAPGMHGCASASKACYGERETASCASIRPECDTHQAFTAGNAAQAAKLCEMDGFKEDAAGAWAPLSHLTALTSLELGVGSCLLAELAACTALAQLDASEASGLWQIEGGPTAWAPVRHLTRLTKLVGPCRAAALAHLPPSVQDLHCRWDQSVYAGRWPAATTQADLSPLSRLTALTRLDLAWGFLPLFPAALSACCALRELLLDGAFFSRLPEAAFQPLAQLGALTRLSLRKAGLGTVPPALGAATALVDLDLSGCEQNPFSGFEPELGHLPRLAPLTRLQVGSAGAG